MNRAGALSSVLQAEHDALAAFVSLLQAEQEILVHGDAGRLAELAPDKERQLQHLARLGEECRRTLQSNGIDLSAQAPSWLDGQADATAARKLWSELLVRARAAREINRSNGLLVESRLQQNRMKLSVLQAAASPEAVYRSDGLLHAARRAGPLRQV